MTSFVVPCVWCKVSIRSPTVLGGRKRLAGEIVDLPYGVALQGQSQGVLGAILDADDKHLEALQQLGIYGADAWFPEHLQTSPRVAQYFSEEINGYLDTDRSADQPDDGPAGSDEG